MPAPQVGRGRPLRKAPNPHVTLVRRVDEDLISALRSERHGPLGVAWLAEHVVIHRSHLGPEGSTYETLHVADLAPPPIGRDSV